MSFITRLTRWPKGNCFLWAYSCTLYWFIRFNWGLRLTYYLRIKLWQIFSGCISERLSGCTLTYRLFNWNLWINFSWWITHAATTLQRHIRVINQSLLCEFRGELVFGEVILRFHRLIRDEASNPNILTFLVGYNAAHTGPLLMKHVWLDRGYFWCHRRFRSVISTWACVWFMLIHLLTRSFGRKLVRR